MANSAKTAKKSPKTKKNGQKMNKIFLRKSAIFQPLMRGTAKQHGFLNIGADLVAKRALGQMGQIHPISTCIQGKSANFSKYGFSVEPMLNYVWMDPARPLGTSRTPQGHLSLIHI